MRLRWTLNAARDLESVQNFIGRDNPIAALDTVAEIIKHVGILVAHPGIGRSGRVKGTRELVVPGLPYIVAYRQKHDIVTVLAVIHGAMKWPDRF